MSPSLTDFLKHIVAECDFIIRNTDSKTKEDILDDEVLTRALVRSLEIIGEATKKLPNDFRVKNAHISWSDMAGMRDVLIHDYFGVDYDLVWNTIRNDIPELHYQLSQIIPL